MITKVYYITNKATYIQKGDTEKCGGSGMLKGTTTKLYKDERGITGLETAIILIAFVVVASVFAYTVLSAGMYSSQKGQEAIFAGLDETRSTIEIKGSMIAQTSSGGNGIATVMFVVANALDGEPIDLTPPTDTDGDHITDSGSTNVTTISYTSSNITVSDIPWSTTSIGRDDTDDLLEPGEQFRITVDLEGVGENIGIYHMFSLEIRPTTGSILRIEKITPPHLDPVMMLD